MASLAAAALDIVDGWDFQDEELVSVLGKKATKNADQIYEELLEICRANPLNHKPVPKGFNQHMRPLIMGTKL